MAEFGGVDSPGCDGWADVVGAIAIDVADNLAFTLAARKFRPDLTDQRRPVAAGKRRSKLRRRLLACISPARAAAVKTAERASGAAVVDPVERYPVPYTLAVSTVDKLTLELDFCADDVAGGAH